ncbi:MAG: hypothetical protein AAF560_25025 [Acidobacteriota bacterium]
MRLNDRPTATLHRTLLAAIFLAIAPSAIASPAEQTLIVPPGTDSIPLGLASQTVIQASHGPFHGQLAFTSEGAVYEPGDGFVDAGADVIILTLTPPEPAVLRIRIVAGAVSPEDQAVVLGDTTGLPPHWQSWTVHDPGRDLEIINGLFGDAFVFGPEDEDGPTLEAVLDGNGTSGNGTTTSTTHLDVEVREPPEQGLGTNGITFFQILDSGSLVGEIQATWFADAFFTGWKVQLASASSLQASPGFELETGVNRLQIRRWTSTIVSPPIGGLELFVNDVSVANLPAAIHPQNGTETHRILRTKVPGPGQYEMIIQNVTTLRSDDVVDPTERLSTESFDGGLGGAWVPVNSVAQGTSPQTLPGPGDRLDLDFGLVAQGTSSYLEKLVPLVESDDPPGFAFRFWMDPTAVSLDPDTSVRIATACQPSGSCGPVRIWLGHDGQDFTVTATAWRSGGSAARIETPISNAPHLVEVRLRHGWLPGLAKGSLELWIDGELIGRETGIDNHAAQINKLRLGILTDAAGSTGVLGIDDYEAWRFDKF